METDRTWCDLFEDYCDEITQMDVDDYGDITECSGDCENCSHCDD